MIFINNKYSAIYNRIVERAVNRTLSGYTEKHHIVPTSLGGTNTKTNVVRLTPREHFICHLLLTKMTSGNDNYKMKYAFSMIVNIKNIGEGRYTPTGRTYDMTKRLQKEAITEYWTTERRQCHAVLVKQHQGPLTDEGRARNSEYQKSKIWTERALKHNLDICLRNAEARRGKPVSEKYRKSMIEVYFSKNASMAAEIFRIKAEDPTLSVNKICKRLKVDWGTVRTILNRQEEFCRRATQTTLNS